MIKKILAIFILFLSLFFVGINLSLANCDLNGNVKNSIKNCVGYNNTDLYDNIGGLEVKYGFKETIGRWTINISFYLGMLAVFAIVYASATIMLSSGDDEKINKSKSILKWSLFGFIGVMLAGAIITLIINVIYEL